MPAFYYTLTEAFHDDVEGLKTLTKLASTQPIFLRNERWLARYSQIQKRLSDLLEELGFPKPAEFGGLGPNRFAKLLTSVVFGDYVSVYLAALRGVDPSEIKLIPEFRKVMQST
jgi:glucose/mannose-6-phosphate isomerase